MKEIIREVSAPSDEVLAAVREGATEWKGPVIPPHLRRRGIVRVEARIRPPYFELRLRRMISGREYDGAVLRAAVIAAPPGGARIRGECGHRAGGSLVILAAVFVGMVALMWLGGDEASAMIASAFAFMALVWMLIGYTAPRLGPDVEGEFLTQRFEHALAAAEEKAAAGRAITPARRP